MNEIPIENIYYLLSYAFNYLDIDEDVLKDVKDYENIQDLFARILINALNNLIKSGFYRNYILHNEDTSHIRGKINISNSIKRRTLIYHRVNCSYDEFSNDVLFNQIIKSSIHSLMAFPDLDSKLSNDLQGLKVYFQDISSIDLSNEIFSNLRWNKNNQNYILIMSICELIYKMKLPEYESNGIIPFKEFIERYEREAAALFENFVLNFFAKEFDNIRVHNPVFKWKVDKALSTHWEHIPRMETDIVLEKGSKQLIIDTKFYKNILSNGDGQYGKVNQNHLYQIFSYISNSQFNGKISGMLLYASTGKRNKNDRIDYKFVINGQTIYIKELNLNQNWRGIDQDLRDIADFL